MTGWATCAMKAGLAVLLIWIQGASAIAEEQNLRSKSPLSDLLNRGGLDSWIPELPKLNEVDVGDFIGDLAVVTPALEALGYEVSVTRVGFTPPSATVVLRLRLGSLPPKRAEQLLPASASYLAIFVVGIGVVVRDWVDDWKSWITHDAVGLELSYQAPASLQYRFLMNSDTDPCGRP